MTSQYIRVLEHYILPGTRTVKYDGHIVITVEFLGFGE